VTEDFVIDASCWHVRAGAPARKQQALEHFRNRYIVLLEFFREEGLLADAGFGLRVQNWSDFEIRRSDLTEEGYEFFMWCLQDFGSAADGKPESSQLARWKAHLSRVRGVA